MLEYLQAFLVNLAAGACIALLAVLLVNRSRYILVLVTIIISLIPTSYALFVMGDKVPPAQSSFSDFNRSAAINNYGFHWGTFTDQPVNGRSQIEIGTRAYESKSNDGYLKISYILRQKAEAEAYCGTYSGFSRRSAEIRDVSQFRGIRFRVWHSMPINPGVRFHVALGVKRFINIYEADFRYDFTDSIKQNGQAVDVTVPFEDFALPPQFPGDELPLTAELQKEVYQVALVISGNPDMETRGELMIDEIRFFRPDMHLMSHIGSAVVIVAAVAPFLDDTWRHHVPRLMFLACAGVTAPDLDGISILFDHATFYSDEWYSHHGSLHSFAGLIPVSLLLALVVLGPDNGKSDYNRRGTLVVYFLFAYSGGVLHLLEDLPAPPGPWNGLMLFWPFSHERYGGWSHYWWQNEYLQALFTAAAVVLLTMLILPASAERHKKFRDYLVTGCGAMVMVLAVKFITMSRYIEPAQWERYQAELLGESVYESIHTLNSLYDPIWVQQLF